MRRRGRRLAIAILHLVVGTFLPAIDVSGTSDDTDEVVVDVVLSGDAGGGDDNTIGRGARGATADALAAAGADVVRVEGAAELAPADAESLVHDALIACRTAGSLKVIVATPSLDASRIRGIADLLGFQFAAVRGDGAVELYRDLYARSA